MGGGNKINRHDSIHTPFPGWNIFRLGGERHLMERINGRGYDDPESFTMEKI